MGVEQIGSDGIGQAHLAGRHLDDLHFGQQAAQVGVKAVFVGKGQLVREQYTFVGDRDDVVVERARCYCLGGLLHEQRPLGR